MTFSARRACSEDAAFIERLFSLPHVERFLNAPSRDQILAALERADCENYIIEDGGEHVGNLVLFNHGFLVDINIIAAVKPHCGAGTYSLQFAMRRAFEELKCHRVFLEVRQDTSTMRSLVERFGFVQEGVYRDGFQNARTGEFNNLCPYGMLESEYRAGLSLASSRSPS
jgi:RimJ/RimL family protein N-acetyltransferase